MFVELDFTIRALTTIQFTKINKHKGIYELSLLYSLYIFRINKSSERISVQNFLTWVTKLIAGSSKRKNFCNGV